MEVIRSSSLVDVAAAQLRDAILSGALKPGQPVNVRELQRTLGISHIPIREAARLLEAEGLLISRARRSPVVADVDLDDLAAIYELRRQVELPAAALAHERRTRDSDALVIAAFDRFEEVAIDPHQALYWQRHSEFHWALLDGGANTWTRRTLEPLWTAAERYVRLFVSTYASPEATLALHKALLEAYLAEDHTHLVGELERHFTVTEAGVRTGLMG